jgi:hypothetical protein
MGPQAEAAIPALKEISGGEDRLLAREADRTIRKARKP